MSVGNTKKFVVKNGLVSQNIDFVSPDTESTITQSILDSGTLSFDGSTGQLFSITDSLTGTIFSVNDISGIPSIEVDDDGTIRFAEFDGNVLIGTGTDDGTSKLQVNGTATFSSSVSASSFSGDLNYNDITNPPQNLSDFNNDQNFIKLTDLSASGDLSYDSSTGVFSFTERTDEEVRNLLSASGDLSYDSSTGVFSVTTYKSSDFDADFNNKDTDNLSEGSSSLYFTTDRARDSVSASGDLSYNSSTGVFSFTERTDQEVRDLFSASGDLSYNDSTGTFSVTTYKTSDFNNDFSSKDTDDLTEGSSNLYFTTGRIDGHLSGGTGVSYSSGTISIGQDVDPSSNVEFSDLVVTGDLTVQGSQTVLETATLQVEDQNIELGKVDTPTNSTANTGGITVLAGTDGDKTWKWLSATDSWTSSEHIDVISGKEYKINGNKVLDSSSLGSSVVSSSLTSVGTLNSGSISSGFGNINIGSSTFTGNGSGLTNVDAATLEGENGVYYLNYNNFSNTPTIGDGTLTLATSGIAAGSQTFSANQTGNATFTVDVPGTDLAMGGSGNSRTITSSTGTNVSVPAATTTNAGFMSTDDKTKLNGIEAGAEVNVGTNLDITAGTTAGPIVTSSTGSNATLPTATASNSGVVTTNNQTFAGTKTFNNTITGSVSGNAGTATALETARTINGTSFNGTTDITVPGNFANRTTNESGHAVFIGTSATGNQEMFTNSNYRFNPSTGELSATDFNSTSDVNLKDNVTDIKNALDLVNEMRGVRYTWKDNGIAGVGVIAQEIEQVLPEVVSESGDHKTVSYGNVVGVLIEAIKELKTEIEELKRDK